MEGLSDTCFAFDLDGTITSAELLPLIARELDLEREIRLLTDLTISGAVPFEDSFRLRFAILRSAPLVRVQAAVADVALDHAILNFIGARPDQCFVVTGNVDLWIQPLIDRLPCEVWCSRGVVQDGMAAGLESVMHKGASVLELRKRFSRIVAIGDGANDVSMFEAADLGIAYGGIHAPASVLIDVADFVVYESTSLCRLLNTL